MYGSNFGAKIFGGVRLAGWLVAGWPANTQKHCSQSAGTVFFSHNNQPEQYFSVLPNRAFLASRCATLMIRQLVLQIGVVIHG